ncbi:MAG: hypothetical protein FJW36_22985 [Acidobacteria bacterium]|nr:hypothetical protein [Acidobacteriota bacterium]
MLRFVLLALIAEIMAGQTPPRLSKPQEYSQRIDPLLQIKNFGMSYSEDGAADGSILRPHDRSLLSPHTLSLVNLRNQAIPILIDCLSDQRVSAAVFQGNNITRQIRVPIGYLCLDLLLELTTAAGIFIRDCADDGLGACVNQDYYFRPDDYSNCWPDHCLPKPWLFRVQANWRRAYTARRLKFVNPPPSL